MADQPDDLFSRWSRRKMEARRGGVSKLDDAQEDHYQKKYTVYVEERANTGLPVENDIEGQADELQEIDDNTIESDDESTVEIDESEFADVDFDKLDFNSDYSRFMKSGVPQRIRQRALRKLWTSNPLLANLDGMNEYDEDYTDAAMVVGAIKSAYNVGRGYSTEEEIEEMNREIAEREQKLKEGKSEDVVAEDVVDDEDKNDDEPETVADAGAADNSEGIVEDDEISLEADETSEADAGEEKKSS